MTPLRVGIAALAWVVLTAIAPVAESRLTTLRRTTKGKQPLKAFPLDGFTGRSLKDFAASSDNTTCAFLPDTSSHCNGAEHLCYVDDEMGEYIAQTCQTTCKICRSASAEMELLLEQGQTVEVRTGFVLLEGSQREQQLHDGFLMWLEFSGAGGAGISVGNGFVKVAHSTEYAVADERCESYHAAANRLLKQKVSYAIIQSHTCKANLSATFHDAGVLHFVQSGTDVVSGEGGYLNAHSWYLFLDSNEYPRLFLKHMSNIQATRILLMSNDDDPWTRASASLLREEIVRAQANGENNQSVVQTFNYTGDFAAAANEDPSMWRGRLQDMANAPSDLRPDALIVYSRAEGEMIMRQVADIKMPLRGVFITGASSWKGPENKFAKYVITPGQWAADVRSSCFVFGTNENYVNLFAQKHGYEPDYMVAMSTAAGVVFQLALQQAGTVRVSKIMEALSTLSAETIAGRVRFSYNHRNIGRDPILSQYQADEDSAPGASPKLLTVLPMDIAPGQLEDFIDFRCRIFLDDDDEDVCSDEERAEFERCFMAYPKQIQPYSRACLDRITAEEVAKAQGQGQNLAVLIPAASAAVVFALFALAAIYVAHSRWKNSASYFRMMMRKNPPGTLGTGRPVTLVVTDIEDSTAMWEACPQEMNASLAMHNNCLRDALKECYGYEVCTEGDSFTVAFHEAQDALLWCCIVQERIQCIMWPEKIIRHGEGKDKERMQNRTQSRFDSLSGFLKSNGKRRSRVGLLGRQLGNQFSNEEILRGNIIPEFYGIRVRMGVHTSPVNKIDRHPVTNRVVYPNEFVRHTTMISDTACGGQVVISAQTLAETEPDASESWCVLHLGAHILEKPQTEEEKAVVRAIRIRHNVEEVQAPHDSDHADERFSEELFMMVPSVIANRMLYYPPIKTVKQVSGGYLQAPSGIEGDIVIAFAQVHSLASMMVMFEKDIVENFMRLLRDCVNKVLGEADGYECEESGGIFVFAFPSAYCAMQWATEVQEALLKVDWPSEILQHPACETWAMAGQTMFRGPRMKIGMAQGPVLSKNPSKVTGRAVFRGPIMNHAARVKSKAAAGQVVVSSKTWDACTKQNDFVKLDLGEFSLKGLEEPINLLQISKKGSYLQYRSFAVEDKSDSRSHSTSDVVEIVALEGVTRKPSLGSSTIWTSLQSKVIPFQQQASITKRDQWGSYRGASKGEGLLGAGGTAWQ